MNAVVATNVITVRASAPGAGRVARRATLGPFRTRSNPTLAQP